MSRRSPDRTSGRTSRTRPVEASSGNGSVSSQRVRKSAHERFSPHEMGGRIKALNTPRNKRLGGLALAMIIVLVAVIHITSTTHNPSVTTTYATTFFRQSAAKHYKGTAKTGDRRGCARSTSSEWICTVTIERQGKSAVDVYGTVTSSGGRVEAQAGPAQGVEFQDWLTKTGGGCRVKSCTGTTFKS